MTKPFDLRELLARIKAVLRRPSPGEFDLLRAFAQHAGRVLSRDFLLEQTRGREAGPFDRTIDVQVGRLRKKLEPIAQVTQDPLERQAPQLIKSVRGAGYILVSSVETI